MNVLIYNDEESSSSNFYDVVDHEVTDSEYSTPIHHEVDKFIIDPLTTTPH
jgi:hypothetical protein